MEEYKNGKIERVLGIYNLFDFIDTTWLLYYNCPRTK